MDETFVVVVAMTCGALNAGSGLPFRPRVVPPMCLINGVSLPPGIPSKDNSLLPTLQNTS